MTQAYGCPECKSTEDFEEFDLVPGRALIARFDEDGEPEWEGSTEMDWNEQIADPGAEFRYECCSCNAEFDKPVLVDVEATEEEEDE